MWALGTWLANMDAMHVSKPCQQHTPLVPAITCATSTCAEKKEFSTLLIAGGAAVAAALGGLLLDDGVEDVEKAVQTGNIPGLNLAAAPLDESTKLALKVAVGLLAVVAVSVGAGLHTSR